jgi:S1-C subfamily serine protease
MVMSVSAESPGAMAGLLPGDVLLQVGGQSIETVDELLSTVENQAVVLVSFWRGKNRYLAALANRVKPD